MIDYPKNKHIIYSPSQTFIDRLFLEQKNVRSQQTTLKQLVATILSWQSLS